MLVKYSARIERSCSFKKEISSRDDTFCVTFLILLPN